MYRYIQYAQKYKRYAEDIRTKGEDMRVYLTLLAGLRAVGVGEAGYEVLHPPTGRVTRDKTGLVETTPSSQRCENERCDRCQSDPIQ